MNDFDPSRINDRWIRSLRTGKNRVDPHKPYSWSIEKERGRLGDIEDTATLFLTNRECPFTCLMCDLWLNTTNHSITSGEVEDQIDLVLPEIASAKNLKLYNSGNFFDTKAIPREAYQSIAGKLSKYKTLIVESHPNFIDDRCLEFKEMINPELQIAIGLETSHPEILPRLNKKMNLQQFQKSVKFLTDHQIPVRVFILLGLPFLDEQESLIWAKRSIDFAFQCGAECCVLIPLRAGNGAMDYLEKAGYYQRPSISALEAVTEYGIGHGSGRVFADIWDLEKFSSCDLCLQKRKERLNSMNLHQKFIDKIECNCLIYNNIRPAN
ncbi:MAG TPA: radical SAM protein [Cyclobacteriaceae bacterium]|nr:radical SAM protein [Cyclobacteriaceae bacterium]